MSSSFFFRMAATAATEIRSYWPQYLALGAGSVAYYKLLSHFGDEHLKLRTKLQLDEQRLLGKLDKLIEDVDSLCGEIAASRRAIEKDRQELRTAVEAAERYHRAALEAAGRRYQ